MKYSGIQILRTESSNLLLILEIKLMFWGRECLLSSHLNWMNVVFLSTWLCFHFITENIEKRQVLQGLTFDKPNVSTSLKTFLCPMATGMDWYHCSTSESELVITADQHPFMVYKVNFSIFPHLMLTLIIICYLQTRHWGIRASWETSPESSCCQQAAPAGWHKILCCLHGNTTSHHRLWLTLTPEPWSKMHLSQASSLPCLLSWHTVDAHPSRFLSRPLPCLIPRLLQPPPVCLHQNHTSAWTFVLCPGVLWSTFPFIIFGLTANCFAK